MMIDHPSHTSLSPHQNQENRLYTLIAETFSSEVVHLAGWRVNVTEQWIIVSNIHAPMPVQGWKLHVSAGLCSAEAILHRILSALQTEHVHFKVAASLDHLRLLNQGMAGLSQIGKFVTVYPGDDAQAVRLAVALDEATYGLRGPRVHSDRPLSRDSIVSYRYGAYKGQLTYTSSGTVEYVIRTPSGEFVPDIRHNVYKAPDWAVDPFVRAGIASSTPPQFPMMIGKRYFILSSLHQTPRGGVYLAIDTVQRRPCVLKHAERNACLDTDGKDARDNLRHEANIIQLLTPDTCFPAIIDLVEQDGDLYLVMEEIPGETLESYASREWARGRLPAEQVIAWGRELAAILSKLHKRGLVYRDLKPSNVMFTPEKKLCLIDFGLVLEQGGQHAQSNVGTRGYMSPQHLAGEPARITDDVYSLGALLYDVATRARPSAAFDPANLLKRPLAVLNPALGSTFNQLIARCLDPQEENRFPSMEAIDAALALLSENVAVLPPAFGCELLLDTQEAACKRHRALAERLGDTLCQTAQPQAWGVAWLSSYQSRRDAILRDISAGSSGIVLALAEAVAELDDPLHRSILADGAQWLIKSTSTITNLVPGLYIGEAGVGAALLRAGQVLGDDTLITAAAERSDWISAQPYTSQDLMDGAAGRLRFHLLLWDETHHPEHLRSALDAGNWLVSVAEDAGNGSPCWTLPSGKKFLGYAHGAAGIADALLDLFEVCGDERYLQPVSGVIRLLESLAVPILHDSSGLNWPLFVSQNIQDLAGAFWCHGAAGIGKFLLHASEHRQFPQAADMAMRAARTVARTSRWAPPIQCHGLAGSIEFLLDLFQATGDQAYYVEAQSIASLLEAFASTQHSQLVYPSDSPLCITPDYLVGYAGILVCFLRLAKPHHLPHQLSRRAFRSTVKHKSSVDITYSAQTGLIEL